MPPYLNSARSPASGTSPTNTNRVSATRGSTTKRSSPSPGSRRAYSICLSPAARRPACGRSSRPGRSTPRAGRRPDVLRHHHLKTATIPPRGDPSPAGSRCWPTTTCHWPAAGPTEPQAELYRNADADEVLFVHSRPGRAAHACSARCPSAIRLRRHPALHDLPARVRAGHVTRPARRSSRPATSRSRRKYLNPDGQLRLGAPYGERDLHGPRELAVIDRERRRPS